MSSGIAPPEQVSPAPGAAPPPSQFELVIDQRLRQTRRQLAGVETADGLITLAAGVLGYLLLAALLDHWLVPGGMGFGGRLLMLLGLLVGAGAFFAWKILPLVIRRIHPLFAAKTIEDTRPGMKNSLVNLLFLRRQPEQFDRDALSRGVYYGLQRTTAAELQGLDVQTTVDRGSAIRHGYFLAAVLAVLCLYLLLSPKSPLVSIRRVIWPWADVPPPTRVTITEIQPGDAAAFQGETLAVFAKVGGLKEGEPVLVYYTTADGQSVNQAVPMTLPKDGYRFRGELPPGGDGLQQNLTYFLAAGDFRSKVFSVEVQTALAILVNEVRYDYPDYTGLADRRQTASGDVRAIEGTRVSVSAEANRPIAQAVMEMDCDPRRGIAMSPEGTTATGRLTLATRRDDPAQSEYQSYQIRFSDLAGHENRRPVRYRIEVIRDEAPVVSFIDPAAEAIELPVDGFVELKVRAEDPDFALRRVAIRAEREGRGLPIRPLLEKPSPGKPHQGPFEGGYRFEPARLGLSVGDEIQYWAEAADNREDEKGPAPNRSETPMRRITIVAPEGQQAPQDAAGGPGQAGEGGPGQSQEPQPQQPDRARPDQGEPDQGEPDQGEPADQPGEPPPDGRQESEPAGQDQAGQDQAGQDPSRQDAQQQAEPRADQQPGDQGAQAEAAGQQGESATEQSDQAGQKTPLQNGQQAQPGSEGEGQDAQPAAQPDQGQPADASQGSQGPGGENAQQSRQPIDGETNPGDAFEEVLKYRAEKDQGQQGAGESAPGEQQPGEQQPGEQQPGDAVAQGPRQDQLGTPSGGQTPPDGQGPSQPGEAQGGKPSAEQMSPGQRAESGDRPPEKTGQQPEGGGQQAEPQRTPDNEQAGMPDEPAGQEPGDGRGAQSQGAGEPQQPQPSDSAQTQPDARGGDPSQPKGDPGAGTPPADPKGSPSPQEGNQPRDKTAGTPDQSPSSSQNDAQSPSISPKQSDSQGDTAGDRSGGGEEGGGQKSEQEGTGSAGTHTASEQGGARSDQQGQGEAGPRAGDQVKADRPTGQPSGDEQGPGSATRQGSSGQAPGDQPQPDQTASADGSDAALGRPGGDADAGDPNARGGSPSGSPTRGGVPGDQAGQPSTPEEPPPPGGEDVNLDFARKQTELALEYLEDQLAREEPDRELLDRLGWTRQDMEAFVRRWQQMREASTRGGDEGTAAKRRLDEAVKSLGLSPRPTRIDGGGMAPDEVRQLKDSGRFEPPARWKELFEAYTRSISSPQE